jgi:hypothetical protein
MNDYINEVNSVTVGVTWRENELKQ